MLLDSSVLLEIFLDGPLKEVCKKKLNTEVVISVISYYEVYRKLKVRPSEQMAMEAVGSLASFKIAEVDEECAIYAADLSIEHNLGMADSLLLAQARMLKVDLVTLDNDFVGLPGVQVIR
jgi:predicted nucleic acid-binding protein